MFKKSKSDWTWTMSWEELIGCRRRRSSVYYRNILEYGERGRSQRPLIYTRTRRGPNMDPWGTPEIAWVLEEEIPLRTTDCVQQGRYERSQESRGAERL